ncbi:MAG: hypothetical protein O2875_03750 [Planctomycetota bacterium]|nr:hypothetical protein [Planctomycetota bacterium]MDA1261803.1 hypothetical protein [Planctomycetota bacterium]
MTSWFGRSAVPVLLSSVVALTCIFLGCTDVRTMRVDSPKTPEDFSVDVTILTGIAAKDLPQAHLRQGKFTVLADGSLCSDYGDSLNFLTRPAPTRWLYRNQVDELWKLAADEGWLETSASSIDVWPGSLRPAKNEIVYIIFFHADGVDWWFVRRFQTSDIPDPKAVAFIRSLCALAWSSDRSPDRNLPRRYDFGPNPYEGFTKAPPWSFATSTPAKSQ